MVVGVKNDSLSRKTKRLNEGTINTVGHKSLKFNIQVQRTLTLYLNSGHKFFTGRTLQ